MPHPSHRMPNPPDMYYAVPSGVPLPPQGYHPCFAHSRGESHHAAYYHLPQHHIVEYEVPQAQRYHPYGEPKSYRHPESYQVQKGNGIPKGRFVFPPFPRTKEEDDEEDEDVNDLLEDSSPEDSNRASPMSPIFYTQEILQKSPAAIKQYERKEMQKKKNKHAQRKHRAGQKQEILDLKEQIESLQKQLKAAKNAVKFQEETANRIATLEQELQAERDKNKALEEQSAYIQQLLNQSEAEKLRNENSLQIIASLQEELGAQNHSQSTHFTQSNQQFQSEQAQNSYCIPFEETNVSSMCYPAGNNYCYPSGDQQHTVHTVETSQHANYGLPQYCQEQSAPHHQTAFTLPPQDPMPYPLQTL